MRGLVLTDVFVGVLVIGVSLRPPTFLRQLWARQSVRWARSQVVFAAASPLAWVCMLFLLPGGDPSARWLFLGQWTFVSACMVISAYAQYRVVRSRIGLA
jgi:hypothetical protein